MRNWSRAVRYSSSELIRARLGCFPTHPGHIQMLQPSDVFGDPGERLQPVEADITCGQCFPQIRTIRCPPHGPYQGLRRVGMDIEPGRRPLRKGPATISGGDLTPVQIFEHIELNTSKPGDLGFGIDDDPLLLILGQQIQIHTLEHTFDQ